jgi:hypothetical protein
MSCGRCLSSSRSETGPDSPRPATGLDGGHRIQGSGPSAAAVSEPTIRRLFPSRASSVGGILVTITAVRMSTVVNCNVGKALTRRPAFIGGALAPARATGPVDRRHPGQSACRRTAWERLWNRVSAVVACLMLVVRSLQSLGSLSDWQRKRLKRSYPATLWSLLLTHMKVQVRTVVGTMERLKRLRGGVYEYVLVCACASYIGSFSRFSRCSGCMMAFHLLFSSRHSGSD